MKPSTELKQLKQQLAPYISEEQNKRVLMIVGNRIAGDSRVIKSAVSLRDAGYHVVLLGVRRLKSTFAVDELEGIPLVFVNNQELTMDLDLAAHEEAVAMIGRRAQKVASLVCPRVLYTHDFWGLDIGAHVVRHLYFQSPCYWIHDIHEYVEGYKGILSEERLNYALCAERQFIGTPDKLIVVNESIRDLICRDYDINPAKTLILHNVPRGQERFEAFDLRTRLDIPPETPLGVYVGKATRPRGLDSFVAALKVFPELHLVLFSSAAKQYLAELRLDAEREGVDSRLHFLDYVHDTHVASAIESADFGLSPLTRYGNTDLAIATKIYEYIHAELPIIVSNARLQKEFVTDNNLGLVFDAATPDEGLTDAIGAFLTRGKKGFQPDWAELKRRHQWGTQYQGIIDSLEPVTSQKDFKLAESRGIFHGPGPSAGQPATLARALRAGGTDAECLTIADSHFEYPYDIKWPASQARAKVSLALWAAHRYDVFHFHFRSFISFSNQLTKDGPAFIDLLLLRAMGKSVIMHFRGSEIRVHSEFTKANPFAWDESADPAAGDMADRLRIGFRQHIRELADKILVVDPELRTYVPEAEILPRAIDISRIAPVENAEPSVPLIAHAPSRRALKGTDAVEKAVADLNSRGLKCELMILENLPNDELIRQLSRADIVIDQLRIGWYGVLAVEAMALGKPVVAYIREDLWRENESLPLINANPDNLAEQLRPWIESHDLRIGLGQKARAFVESYHAAEVVAKEAVRIYGEVARKKNRQSPDKTYRLIADQTLAHMNLLKQSAENGAAAPGPNGTSSQRPFTHKLRELLPGNWSAPAGGEKVRSKKKASKKKKTGKEVIEPGHEFLRFQRQGDILLARDRTDEAFTCYERSLECYPRNFLLLSRIADHIIENPHAVRRSEMLDRAIEAILVRTGTDRTVFHLNDSISFLRRKLMRGMVGASHKFPAVSCDSAGISGNAVSSKKRLVLLTCVWQRPALTSVFLDYYRRLQGELADRVELILLAVGSEEKSSRDLCESHGFDYLEHPNSPLSDKWDYGLGRTREYDPDGVVIMGSDDFVTANLFSRYADLLDEGVLFMGLTDGYFFDLASRDSVIHWKGYGGLIGENGMPNRLGETIGMGRLLSAKLLEMLDYSIWGGLKIDRSLDRHMNRRLHSLGMLPVKYADKVPVEIDGKRYYYGQLGATMKDLGVAAVDIKSPDTSVTGMTRYLLSGHASKQLGDSNSFLKKQFPGDLASRIGILQQENGKQ